jgi:phosphomannomutase
MAGRHGLGSSAGISGCNFLMSEVIKFGTDGWRAIIAEDFTIANVERVAYAIGKLIVETYGTDVKKRPVLVGYDTRFMAERFASRAAHVLAGMGLIVRMSIRDVPTPAIAFAAQREPTAGALQFTASHNPPEYLGIKYIPDYGGPATNEITAKISSFLTAMPQGFAPAGEVQRFDPHEHYIPAVLQMVDAERISAANLSIVVDTIYSTSRDYLDDLLNRAGAENVAVLHNWPDPMFGGGMPEPKPEYLGDLMRTVVKLGYQLGLATDGDADRFAVIDEKGTYITPNHCLCLLARHLVKNRGLSGAIVRNIATTHLLDRVAELYGLPVIETRVGFKYIGEVMRSKDVLLGGEESGGVSVKGHIPEKDGILAGLLFAEMLAYERKPLSVILSDLIAEVGTSFSNYRGDFRLDPSQQKAIIHSLKDDPPTSVANRAVTRVDTKDGIKIYLEDSSWLLLRPSGTEPLMRITIEAGSPEDVDKIRDGIASSIYGSHILDTPR